MCSDYEQHIAGAEYCLMMESLAPRIPAHQTELDLPQADDVRINDPAPIVRTSGDTIELASMTFGFPPSGPKGAPYSTSAPKAGNSPTATAAWCLLRGE